MLCVTVLLNFMGTNQTNEVVSLQELLEGRLPVDPPDASCVVMEKVKSVKLLLRHVWILLKVDRVGPQQIAERAALRGLLEPIALVDVLDCAQAGPETAVGAQEADRK